MTPDAKTPPEPRPAISRMHPYEWEPPSASIARQAGVPQDQVVRFDTNTFPWAGARLDQLQAEPLNEYPDTSYASLTEAIAQYADVPADRITVGAGADEILDMIAKAYIEAATRVVMARPTYPMFRILTEMAGGSIDEVLAGDPRHGPAGAAPRQHQRRVGGARRAGLSRCRRHAPAGAADHGRACPPWSRAAGARARGA